MEESKASNAAIIIVPEIYGVNSHILTTAEQYKSEGFKVIIVDLYGKGMTFSYSEPELAYEYFIKNAGFKAAADMVNNTVLKAKEKYRHVYILGYSVGATAAWLCSSMNNGCSGIIGLYGSRIREYVNTHPLCPVLLIFAEWEKSFSVQDLANVLKNIENVDVHLLRGKHGFCDSFSKNYYSHSAKTAKKLIKNFLNRGEKDG